MILACPGAQAMAIGSVWGLNKSLPSPEPQRVGVVPFRGPASSGPLRPSTLACFDLPPFPLHTGSHSLGTLSAVLFSAQGHLLWSLQRRH